MTVLNAAICGLVQGITEFLPVSSSAHLALCERMFGKEAFSPDVTFDILLHLGTLAAVAIFCRKELRGLLSAVFSVLKKALCFRLKTSECSKDERLALCLFFSSLPLVFAALLEERVEAVRASAKAIGVLLMINGIMLIASDALGRMKKPPEKMTKLDAFVIGLFQLCAVFPGISRSGATVTGGLIRGFDREFAVKYSFLMSVPAVLGANLFSLGDFSAYSLGASGILPVLAGTLSAALAGFAAMKLLVYVSKGSRFAPFAVYCIAAGTATVFFIN